MPHSSLPRHAAAPAAAPPSKYDTRINGGLPPSCYVHEIDQHGQPREGLPPSHGVARIGTWGTDAECGLPCLGWHDGNVHMSYCNADRPPPELRDIYSPSEWTAFTKKVSTILNATACPTWPAFLVGCPLLPVWFLAGASRVESRRRGLRAMLSFENGRLQPMGLQWSMADTHLTAPCSEDCSNATSAALCCALPGCPRGPAYRAAFTLVWIPGTRELYEELYPTRRQLSQEPYPMQLLSLSQRRAVAVKAHQQAKKEQHAASPTQSPIQSSLARGLGVVGKPAPERELMQVERVPSMEKEGRHEAMPMPPPPPYTPHFGPQLHQCQVTPTAAWVASRPIAPLEGLQHVHVAAAAHAHGRPKHGGGERGEEYPAREGEHSPNEVPEDDPEDDPEQEGEDDDEHQLQHHEAPPAGHHAHAKPIYCSYCAHPKAAVSGPYCTYCAHKF